MNSNDNTSVIATVIGGLSFMTSITATVVISNALYKKMTPSAGSELALVLSLFIATCLLFIILLVTMFLSNALRNQADRKKYARRMESNTSENKYLNPAL